ncbi:MAG: lipid A biosynthesis (KDO)2-(lauroyl)-lipid IVA acyltransferase [Bacteroidales bacterium]|jgi:predicted LPLAT superfamily acyltransferase|nr:lipid A biosynthesis (KDO)2-(lauroyl)-lipid IVA acyltransferase [Bacteroidales bacterium]
MITAKNRPWKGTTGGNTLGQKGLLLLFRIIHIKALYAIVALVVPFYMLFRLKGYLPIYRYFRKRFHNTPLRAFCNSYRNHFRFGQCMLDRFAVYTGKDKLFTFEFTGHKRMMDLIHGEKGFIIASAHIGNFELSGYMEKHDHKRIHTLVYGGETKEVMKNRNKSFRKRNVSMIPVKQDFSHIFVINDALSKGEVISILCDRNTSNGKTAQCSFLEGKANFPLGAFMLALQFDVPVLTVFVMKEGISHYHVYIKPLFAPTTGNKTERATHYAQAFANELETIVRKYPEQWFNYYEFWKDGL